MGRRNLVVYNKQKKNKIINMPKSLNDFLQTINVGKWEKNILLSILNVVKQNQVGNDKSEGGISKLQLFDIEWSDDNSTATFHFHFKDFCEKGKTYRREYIEKALMTLTYIGNAEHNEMVNGELVKRFTGVIFNPIWNPNKHTCTFQMTASWYRLFVMLDSFYSKILYEEVLTLSSRAGKFFYKLNEFERLGGFHLSRKKVCEYFDIDELSKGHLEKDVLKPLRKELDNKGELSFNYSYDKDTDVYNFIVYRLRNPNGDKVITTNVVSNATEREMLTIKTAIKYIKKARQLNENQIDIFIKICLKYGYDTVKNTISNRRKDNPNSFLGMKSNDFIEKLLQTFPYNHIGDKLNRN